MKEISKNEYIEFFKWLFGPNIKIKNEFDISMAHSYYDPNIYYTEEIYNLFQTAAMQRLKKIPHLGGIILLNENVYHNRLEHSKGAYRRCIEFLATQYKNAEWRKYIQDNKQKGYLVDIIKFMCTHDIGHSMLSHSIEEIIGDCSHEEIGEKIRKEDEEVREALNNITANEEKSNKADGTLKFLCEGNIDFDRSDFLSRDSLFVGYKTNIDEIISNLNNSCKLEKLQDGSLAYVYNNSAIKDIEKILMFRKAMYNNYYRNKEIAKTEYYLRHVLKRVINGKEDCELKQTLSKFYNKSIEKIDIKEYIKTDVIVFINQLINSINCITEPKTKALLGSILPKGRNMLQLAINMLDPKNKNKSYNEEETCFIQNVEKVIKKQINISSNINDYIVAFESDNKDIFNQVKEREGIIKYERKLKIYNPDEPIYVKDKKGNIIKLEDYPELSISLEPEIKYGIYVCKEKLIENGASEVEIKEILNKLEKYNTSTKENSESKVFNMSLIKTENSEEEAFEGYFEER